MRKLIILFFLTFSSLARVTSHKTAGLEYPENTLEGFLYSLQLSVDAIEFDVHFTKDKHAVLAHDPVLDDKNCFKDIGKRLIISQLTLKEIQNITCYNSKLKKDFVIPTLDEILMAFKESGRSDIELNFEIKVLDKLIEKSKRYKGMNHSLFHLDESEMANLSMNYLRKYDISSHVLFTTFSRSLLLKLKSLKQEGDEFRYGLLFKGVYSILLYPLVKFKGLECYDSCWWPNWKNTYQWLIENEIDVFLPNWPQLSHPLYNKRFKKVFQKDSRPFEIYPWTLNGEEDWIKSESYDFDGMITDLPSLYLRR